MDSSALYKLVFGVMLNDAALRTLVGYSASDPKMYYQFPEKEVKLTADSSAYITYTLEAFGGYEDLYQNQTRAIRWMNLVLDIYSPSMNTILPIWDRLVALYNGQRFSNSAWEIPSMVFDLTFRDLSEIQDARTVIRHRHTRFKFTAYSKTTLVTGAE